MTEKVKSLALGVFSRLCHHYRVWGKTFWTINTDNLSKHNISNLYETLMLDSATNQKEPAISCFSYDPGCHCGPKSLS